LLLEWLVAALLTPDPARALTEDCQGLGMHVTIRHIITD
jgi:hypothetical protein